MNFIEGVLWDTSQGKLQVGHLQLEFNTSKNGGKDHKAVSYTHLDVYKRQVVGNICGNFYDETGAIIETLADKRRISISLQDLKKIPLVIGVAGGKNKFLPILGALKGRFIQALITDDLTAQLLINHKE